MYGLMMAQYRQVDCATGDPITPPEPGYISKGDVYAGGETKPGWSYTPYNYISAVYSTGVCGVVGGWVGVSPGGGGQLMHVQLVVRLDRRGAATMLGRRGGVIWLGKCGG